MDKNKLEALRHSCEHVLTMAMLRIWGNKIKAAMGPATEDGFYFDFDSQVKISEDDFKRIEKEMKKIIEEDLSIVRDEMTVKEARIFFDNNIYKGNEYKHEWLDDIESRGENVAIYWMGEKRGDIPGTFVDICSGPHLDSTGQIGAFKLLKIAGAYWHGDEKNKMLTRIYGTAFETKEELKAYLHMIEEAKKRDHRKLSAQLELFSFHEEGPGFPFFKPQGMVIWNELMNYWHEAHRRAGYGEVKTPVMLSKKLWETSGHWENYREHMYESRIDDMEYAIKPMNCPGGMLMFKEGIHSYRELPMRWGEVGLVHRHELSGVLAGLFRVRSFHQDDAHIFMRPDQITKEILGVLKLTDQIYSTFGLSYHLELSTRPEKSVGSDEAWNMATTSLKQALDESGREYVINEGDGAFYGPKIDIHIKDAIGRTWQCGTIQLDMNLPERFDLTYVDSDGEEKRPVMIHRVIYGSVERFFGILVEHYAGAFPVWLSPVQVQFVPVSEKHIEGAQQLAQEFFDTGIRIKIDEADETVGNKIRKAATSKVPYVVVVGDKELSGEDWMIRVRGEEDQVSMSKDEFMKKVLGEIEGKK